MSLKSNQEKKHPDIRTGTDDITTDVSETKQVRRYYKQCSANRFEN
jgi:hypothetical protein